jgi:hypothetical protein
MNHDWNLDTFEVKYNSYGDFKGQYTGKVQFKNGDGESFSFNLRDGMIQPFINLIAGEMALSANSLRDRLLESLGLKAAPVQQTTPQGQKVESNPSAIA